MQKSRSSTILFGWTVATLVRCHRPSFSPGTLLPKAIRGRMAPPYPSFLSLGCGGFDQQKTFETPSLPFFSKHRLLEGRWCLRDGLSDGVQSLKYIDAREQNSQASAQQDGIQWTKGQAEDRGMPVAQN